jgi:hypothetical protein
MPTYLKSFIGGTGVAILILAVGLLFMNQPQCPANYTQQQVDASNCVVGANIGLGMMYMLSIVIEVVTVIVTSILYITKKRSSKQ